MRLLAVLRPEIFVIFADPEHATFFVVIVLSSIKCCNINKALIDLTHY